MYVNKVIASSGGNTVTKLFVMLEYTTGKNNFPIFSKCFVLLRVCFFAIIDFPESIMFIKHE